jgi:hypothetical protein
MIPSQAPFRVLQNGDKQSLRRGGENRVACQEAPRWRGSSLRTRDQEEALPGLRMTESWKVKKGSLAKGRAVPQGPGKDSGQE